MAISKKLRMEVRYKFHDRCAYCGCKLTDKSFQIDHVVSKRNGGSDKIENLMPACRSCNHYKRADNIEGFRWLLLCLREKVMKTYQARVADSYGMVTWNGWDGVFFFERMDMDLHKKALTSVKETKAEKQDEKKKRQ